MRKRKSNTTFRKKLYCFFDLSVNLDRLLIEWNLNAIFIKSQLNFLNQLPAGRPVVFRRNPAADLQIHRAVRQVVYYNHVILILQDGGLRGQQIQADFFGQLQIRR